jgi:two-component system, LytTR family, response regulator
MKSPLLISRRGLGVVFFKRQTSNTKHKPKIQPNRMKTLINTQPTQSLAELETLAQQFHLTELLLPFGRGRQWMPMHQIVRLEGDGNYTTFFFRDGSRLMVSLTLKTLSARLPLSVFARPHKKNMINLLYLNEIGPGAKPYTVQLSTGELVNISRRKAADFLRHVSGFQETMKQLKAVA